jgi:hypothetical protein
VNCIFGFRTACSAILSSFVDTVCDLNVSSVFPCSGRHTRLHLPAIYSGSLGLHHFPTYTAAVVSPRPSVLCSTKTASVHLGSVRFRSLPNTSLLPFVCVPPFPAAHRGAGATPPMPGLLLRRYPLSSGHFFVRGDRRLSQVRELPLYAHAPVLDPGGVPHACHIALGTDAFQVLHPVGFRSLSEAYPFGPPCHNVSGFNVAACALASPLLRTPPLRDRTSVPLPACRLRFGLAGFPPAGQHQQISAPIGTSQRFTFRLAR